MTTAIAVALLLLFFVIDARFREGPEARSLTAGATDRGTTQLFAPAIAVSMAALLLSPLLDASGVLLVPDAVAWGGLAVMVLGLSLRIWSMRVLGASYTRTLRLRHGHELVSSGPYRLLRHPGYAGALLMWLGAGVATANVVVALVVVGAQVAAYTPRVAAEEDMLTTEFGDRYREYARHTWRLIPFIY